MSSITTVRRGEKFGTINEILEEQGCIVIENMLDEARHEALEGRILPLLDATAPCRGNFYGFSTKRSERADRQIKGLQADGGRARYPRRHG